MNTIDIIQSLIPTIGSLLLAALTWGAVKLTAFIKTKTQNEMLKGVLVRATDAVTVAVKEVGQTYVDAMKEANADGVLTDIEKRNALNSALAKAKAHLGPKGLDEVLYILGLSAKDPQAATALDAFLTTRIEAAVVDAKALEVSVPK